MTQENETRTGTETEKIDEEVRHDNFEDLNLHRGADVSRERNVLEDLMNIIRSKKRRESISSGENLPLLKRILKNLGEEDFMSVSPKEPLATLRPVFEKEAFISFVKELNGEKDKLSINTSLKNMCPEGIEPFWLLSELVSESVKEAYGATDSVAASIIEYFCNLVMVEPVGHERTLFQIIERVSKKNSWDQVAEEEKKKEPTIYKTGTIIGEPQVSLGSETRTVAEPTQDPAPTTVQINDAETMTEKEQ